MPFLLWPCRLQKVRTPAFHVGKPGSIPGGATMQRYTSKQIADRAIQMSEKELERFKLILSDSNEFSSENHLQIMTQINKVQKLLDLEC